MAFIFLQIQSSQIGKFPRQIKGLRVFQRGLFRLFKEARNPQYLATWHRLTLGSGVAYAA